MTGLAAASERAAGPTTTPSRQPAANFRGAILAIVLVSLCFLLFWRRPYSVVSDTGYLAFGARQFAEGYNAVFNSIRLVNPRDLAKDLITPLTDWSPGWAGLYVLAFKAGLPAGVAGRLLALLISMTGAVGWVRVISVIGLRGRWRLVGIAAAALYCLRTGIVTKMGSGDLIVYAAAPWLLAAAAPLAKSAFAARRTSRVVILTSVLCFALGSIYWLKYSGIFLSMAIFLAVVIEQFRGRIRRNTGAVVLTLALYGAAFAAPALALKAFNYKSTGTDFMEASARRSPPRSAIRLIRLLTQTAYYTSPVLFSAGPGIERISGEDPSVRGWILRIPGFVLLAAFFFLMLRRPPSYIRNVAILSCAIPLVAMPAASFLGGLQFTFAMERLCQPYWILAELMVLFLLSQPESGGLRLVRIVRSALGAATVIQALFFLWIPWDAGREAWKVAHNPRYDSSAAQIWDTDLSKYGTREIDARVQSLVRGPRDVIVPALYSNRAFATDTMLEFGGRLLPLTVMFSPLVRTHGRDGANYYSTAPFYSSAPLRVILVATDPYNRDDFRAGVERVMSRFTQISEWTPAPVDPHGRVWAWTGEIR